MRFASAGADIVGGESPPSRVLDSSPNENRAAFVRIVVNPLGFNQRDTSSRLECLA